MFDGRYLTGFVSCAQDSVIAVIDEKIIVPLHIISLIS